MNWKTLLGAGVFAVLLFGGYRIALIEDHPLVRKSIAQTLDSLGFEVRAFAGGAEFIQWLSSPEREEIALVLSDVVMPGMSGPDVWVSVREQEPGLPFLFLTGYAGKNLAVHNVPDDMILMKPVTGRVLMQKIIEQVKRHEQSLAKQEHENGN